MSRTKQRQEVRALLRSVPLDNEEVYALEDMRGVDRDTARLAYRLSAVDHVDLAIALAPLIARQVNS